MRKALHRYRALAVKLFAIARDNPAQLGRIARAFVFGHQKYRTSFLKPEDWRQSDSEVRKRLYRNLTRRPIPMMEPSWKREAIEILVRRSQRQNNHADATEALTELTDQLGARADVAESYLAFAKACASVGLFEGSYGFVQLAYDRIELDAKIGSDLRDALKSIRVAIHRRRIDIADERWERLQARAVPSGSQSGFEMLEVYLSACRGTRQVEDGTGSGEREWRKDLAGAKVLILGPAPVGFDSSKAGEYDFVAQIYRKHEVPSFPEAEAEILYVGGLYHELKQRSSHELHSQFGRFRYFVVNSVSSELGLSNTRRADRRLSSLFVRGTPNMIQVMCLDMLGAGAASLYVTGANFYASPEPYGSGGGDDFEKFGFCCAIASHNPTENRAVIANLVDAGAVSGDEPFLRVLGLSDIEYLRLLDKYYGVPQR